jgi:hypothetical protein
VWFTFSVSPLLPNVYKTLGNNGLCAVGVVYGITVLWYIPLVAVCPIRGVPGNCGSGGVIQQGITLRCRLRACARRL